MGGAGSGGYNRTHGTIEDHKRIDSFGFQDWLKGDQNLFCKDMVLYRGVIKFHPQAHRAEIKTGGQFIDLKLSCLDCLDGRAKQLFFICPACEARVRFLYDNDGFFECRDCMGANYHSSQSGGMKKLTVRMKRIVERQLHYTQWAFDNPGVRISELPPPPKPKYMRWTRYKRLVTELKSLQDEYATAEYRNLLAYMPNDVRKAFEKAGIKNKKHL